MVCYSNSANIIPRIVLVNSIAQHKESSMSTVKTHQAPEHIFRNEDGYDYRSGVLLGLDAIVFRDEAKTEVDLVNTRKRVFKLLKPFDFSSYYIGVNPDVKKVLGDNWRDIIAEALAHHK